MSREPSNISQNVRDLDAQGREWLERSLGRKLDDDERVYVVTTLAPDEATRHAARDRLRKKWAEIDAQVQGRGMCQEDIESLVDEACDRVRHGSPD